MKYPYSTRYQPSFPVVQVVLRNSDEELHTATEVALLDTGSDGSLVPIAHLRVHPTIGSLLRSGRPRINPRTVKRKCTLAFLRSGWPQDISRTW